ncbi:MAG: efflux RND transporter permease subunit [Cyanobacteriota bacterium]|nr:efflux RND transporter permease subunit [Cyanobacteriota bacterium]
MASLSSPSHPPRPSLSVAGLSIRRHIATLVLTIAVVVLGGFYLARLPIDLLPSITYPRIAVRVNAPGLAPEIAVDEITRPLEEAVATTEGVVQVFSQTREGRVSVDLYFQPGGNIDQALNDTTATVNRSLGSLPDTIEPPRIFKFDPSQLPVYEFALTSDSLTSQQLRIFGDEELARELGVVAGVASVDVAGGSPEEVRIELDLNRLQSLGLGLTDVLNGLRERNLDVSGGRIETGNGEILTRTLGRFTSAEGIENLPFATANGQLIPLRDFAEVIDGAQEERVVITLNGGPAVKVSIQKQPEANTVAVVDGVKRRLEQLRQSGLISPDMQLTATNDESRFIRSSIQNVAMSGLSGAVLAGIAVFLFLGSLRQTLIIILAIPLATMAAIILMGLFGLTLNIFSLGGLALGVGIVVDNSIVMMENIANGVRRIVRDPLHPERYSQQVIEQAERSSQELESALLASTTTNLVSVTPFLLLGGLIALLFNELVLTISFSVAASLLVGLTIVPMLTSRLLALPWSSGLQQSPLLRGFHRGVVGLTVAYQQTLSQILSKPLLVLVLVILVLGGGGTWMAGQISQEILPRISTGLVNLSAQFPSGTPLSANRRVMQALDEILLAQPQTDYVFTTSGGSLFGNNINENPLRGSSTITLKAGSNVEGFIEQVDPLLSRLNLVGTRLRLNPGSVRGLVTTNSPVRADIDVILQSDDPQPLQQAGQQVLAALDAQAKLARYRPDAEDPQPEIQIQPDWQRAAALGLTTEDIGDTVATALQGSVPTRLQRGNRLVDVRVQLAEGSLTSPSQVATVPLFVGDGQPIRLGDVATLGVGQAPGEVQRLNQRQVFIITGTLNEGVSYSQAAQEMESILGQLTLPSGVTVLPSTTAQSNRELRNSLITLGLLASFLVFVVMAVQYNSLVDPLVIMLTIPLSLVGGILGLYVTQTAMGASVIVGAVLLVGIVVNNAILMVELANQIRQEQGVDVQQAIWLAAPQRLQPILMTTITTVLGLFPLAVGGGEGSELLQPLGIVVFSGLSLATLLTLFVIPCFYVVLHRLLSSRQQRIPDTLDWQDLAAKVKVTTQD